MICKNQPQTSIKNIYIVSDELRYDKDLSRKSLAAFGCSCKNCPVYFVQIRRVEWIFCSLRIVQARSTCVAMDRKECHAVEKDIQGTEECQYPNTKHWPKEHYCSQHDRSTRKILLYYIHICSSFVATKPSDLLIMCTSWKDNLIYILLHYMQQKC